jgi:hypothetical protein
MAGNLKDKRINGEALEQIMQDVLQGMMQFTEDTCAGCNAAGLEIQSVEPPGNCQTPPANNIVPFAHPGKKS